MIGVYESTNVLDLTHVLAGPFCSYQFALLGADVIKIEPPDNPDCARGRGPFPKDNALGLGLNYQVQGANKRALALDLSHPQGAEILRKLAAKADVLIENFTTGSLSALGLGSKTLCQENPRLIYCSITGYGDVGPQARTGAYDNVIQAASGVIAQSDGHKPGLSFIDYATGYAAAFGVAAALYQREKTQKGSHISVSMFETAMSLMAPEVAAAQQPVVPMHRKEAGILQYETLDGHLMPGVFTPAQYRKLAVCFKSIGIDLPLLDNCRQWTDVWQSAKALKVKLEEIFATRSADDWVKILNAADLPAERILTLGEAVTRPQLDARSYFASHPEQPNIKLPLGPIRFREGGPSIRRPPPRHGEHTDEILQELGFGSANIAELRQKRIVG